MLVVPGELLRECPAYFLILKSVVSSSHEEVSVMYPIGCGNVSSLFLADADANGPCFPRVQSTLGKTDVMAKIFLHTFCEIWGGIDALGRVWTVCALPTLS